MKTNLAAPLLVLLLQLRLQLRFCLRLLVPIGELLLLQGDIECLYF